MSPLRSVRSAWAQALSRTRRSDAAASQGGFVLVMVLGVIGLTAVVVVALLGLALTSARVSAAQRETAREQRAAASALEAAVGQFAYGAEDEPCDALPDAANLTFEADGERPGVPVTVDCESIPWVPPTAPPVAAQPELVSMNPAPPHTFPRVDFDIFGNCNWGCPQYTTRWSAEGDEPLRSALLLIQSDEGENIHNAERNIVVTVTPSAASGRGACTVNVPGGRLNEWAGGYTAVDLFSSSGCRTQLADQPRSVLDDAVITVRHAYRPGGGCPLLCSVQLRVGENRLLTNFEVIEAESLQSGGAWGNAAAVTQSGGGATAVSQSRFCEIGYIIGIPVISEDERCRRAIPDQIFPLSIAGFTPSGAEAPEPDTSVDTLGVIIEAANASGRSWISDVIDGTWFQVDLQVGGGGSCSVQHGGFARSAQRMYVDLFVEPDCRELVRTVDDLADATLTFSVRTDCGHGPDMIRMPVGPDGTCNTVRLPDLDRIALAITTPPEPTTSRVTLTARVQGREAPTAQADVFLENEATLPRSTPVIGWRYCAQTTCADPGGTPPVPGP